MKQDKDNTKLVTTTDLNDLKKITNSTKTRKRDSSLSSIPAVKTEEERRKSSREILKQLEDLDLSISHAPIRELLKLLKQYNEEGNRVVVNIPFPELNRRIKGVLATGAREETYIVLKYEKF